jgi:serine/threonine protein kinase
MISYFNLRVKYLQFYIFRGRIGNYKNQFDYDRIGYIDQDGLIHVATEHQRLFNPSDIYTEGEFLQRKKFYISVLLKEDTVYIEKKFNNHFFDFYNELSILNALRNIECVPKIFSVDYKNLSFVTNYIYGYCLREKLAKRGVIVRDVDLIIAGKKQVSHQCEEKLATVMNEIVSKELLVQIKKCIKKVHQKKVLIVDIKYGNIIINNGKPYLIDFNDSILFNRTPNFIFKYIKKADKVLLNNIFKYVN